MPDVIVIGAGIAGCCTAVYLAEDGVDVLVLEREAPNARASGSNAGSLHAQIQHEPFVRQGEAWARRFSPAIPFYLASIRLWEEAEALVGRDLEVARTGGLLVAANDAQLRQVDAKARLDEAAGLTLRLLDRVALREVAPYLGDDLVGGLLCLDEGKANPLIAATAFADAAIARGVRIEAPCEVKAIGRRSGGDFVVATTRGEFRAPRLVDAAGADAGRIAALLGVHLAIQAFPIQLAVTEPLQPLVDHLLYSAADPLTLKQSRAGTVLIGGGWPARIDALGRPQVSLESLTRNVRVALQVVPALADAALVRCWAGIVNGTEDWLPIIGEAPRVPGFFLNYVPWMGFTGGPAGGRIVASLVQGRDPPVSFDPGPFAPS